MDRSKAGMNKKSNDGLIIARAHRPQRSLRPEAVDKLQTNQHLYSIHNLGGGGGVKY